jgi:hypothetical protein
VCGGWFFGFKGLLVELDTGLHTPGAGMPASFGVRKSVFLEVLQSWFLAKEASEGFPVQATLLAVEFLGTVGSGRIAQGVSVVKTCGLNSSFHEGVR